MPIPWRLAFAILFFVIAVIAYLVARATAKSKESTSSEPEPERESRRGYDPYYDRSRSRSSSSEEFDPKWAKNAGHVMLGLAVLLFVLSCFTIVGTKQVGIVTSFGRPIDSLGAGIHFKLPWQKVPEMDGAIQTDNFTGDSCVDVRMAGDTTGCIDVTVRWRVPESDSEGLYQDYRGIDRIRDSVVVRDLRSALNEEFGDFDPLAALAALAEETESGDVNASSTVNLGDRAESVTERLTEIVGDRVQIQENGITLPFIRYDDRTQGRINALLEEIANTRIERQREQTNIATADANEALADSISNDPNVLVAQCLEIWQSYAEQGIPLPAGSSCWPGGESAVVVPSASNSGG